MSEATSGTAWPAWLREVSSLLAVHSQFVLSGNVRDRYPLPIASAMAENIAEALMSVLEPLGYDALLIHDIVDGYRTLSLEQGVPCLNSEAAWADVNRVVPTKNLQSKDGGDLEILSQVVRSFAEGRECRVALMLDYAGRITANSNELDPVGHKFFVSCLKSSHYAERFSSFEDERPAFGRHLYNPVFWIADREHDLPAWLTAGNRAVRAVPVPWPEFAERVDVSRSLIDQSDRYGQGAVEEIAAGTGGMGTQSIFDVVDLLADQRIPYEDAEDAVRIYNLGVAESPWRRGSAAKRIRETDFVGALSSRVFGQPAAITKCVDIVKRASVGLSGAQGGSGSRKPRGVLFFAGPTGVGKTELAKALTEAVFGNQDAYKRFDMSEFSAEHAGDRLVGAPPGYVGFDAGGELTNAVRHNPFRLLLFDEVEKAHPRILDKLLQILDDGRLTDGRGTTVHFYETIIVFTSNLGMVVTDADGRNVSAQPQDDYAKLHHQVRTQIHRYFTQEINRPELLNRIGDNIVVFDFIRPDVGERIANHMLDNIATQLHKAQGITVHLTEEAHDQILDLATRDLTFGGRGIGNVIESMYVNPLARALSEQDLSQVTEVTVAKVEAVGVPRVILE